MIVPMRVYKRFLTKKKLSSYSWTYWGFALITTIGIGFLFTVVELLKTHDRRVVFYNLKTLNTENNKISSVNNETYLTNDSPVFVFIRDSVLFGTLKSVKAPAPNDDLLILGKDWKAEFNSKINFYKNKNKVFPSTVVGIMFDSELSYNKVVENFQTIYELIEQQNQKNSYSKKINSPSIVLLNLYQNN